MKTKLNSIFSSLRGTFIFVLVTSYVILGVIWQFLEPVTFFLGDKVKTTIGDYWILIFIIPIILAFFAVVLRYIKDRNAKSGYKETEVEKDVFSLEITDVHVQAGIYSYCIPKESLKFKIIMDAVNRCEEEIIIRSIEIVDFVTDVDILDIDSPKISLSLLNLPHVTQDIRLPHTFDRKKRIPSLQLTITTGLKKLPRLEFAEYLKNFNKYSIRLSYTYDNLEHTGIEKIIQIDESFEAFKTHLIEEWSRNSNCKELATVAINSTSKGIQSDIALNDKPFEVKVRNLEIYKPIENRKWISSSKRNRQAIDSSFLDFNECTILIWVLVPEMGKGLRDAPKYKYIFAYQTGDIKNKCHFNSFMLRYSPRNTWEFLFSGPEGTVSSNHQDHFKFYDSLEAGWHQIKISWNHLKPLVTFSIDDDSINAYHTSYVVDWPRERKGSVFVGAWVTDYPDSYCETEVAQLWIVNKELESPDPIIVEHSNLFNS